MMMQTNTLSTGLFHFLLGWQSAAIKDHDWLDAK